MANIKVLSSGSIGNCYLLEHNGRVLMLDCGIPYNKILQGLDFNIEKVDGVIVTHCHNDHLLSARDFEKAGIDVWKPYEHSITFFKKQIGYFKVTSFPLPHDGVENRGFLIEWDSKRLLYMTDYEYCQFLFKKYNINYMLIELNYMPELVDVTSANFSHKIKGHASSETCYQFIKANVTDNLSAVVLCHLGLGTCNAEKVVADVKDIVPHDVYVDVARQGLIVELTDKNECPF